MASTATTRGKYRKQGLGDGLNTWGLSSGLNGLFDVMDEAIHGVNEITLTGTSYTLSSTNYTSNDIRYRILKFTGNFAATITIPATQNYFIIENATGQTLTFSNGSNTATLANTFYGLLTTNGTTVSMLTLPDGTNVATVANAIASVNTVAGDINSVIAVAGKSTEVGRLGTTAAVADLAALGGTTEVASLNALSPRAADIGTLAPRASDIQSLAPREADLNTLSPRAADIGTLAPRASDLQTLAPREADLNTLSPRASDLQTLSPRAADIGTLADVEDGTTATNALSTLAPISAAITGVNTIASDVTAVNTDPLKTNITNVSGNASNINSVSGNSSNINSVAGQISPTNNISTLAGISSDITATAGVATSVTAYAKQYSSGSGDISTRGDGTGTVTEGDIRFRTDTDTMRVYTGSNWQDVAVTAGSFLQVANNLSDLNNAATARTNLGLQTVANTGAYTDLSAKPTHLMITGGSAGTIPYQTAANTTGMSAVGTAGQVLSSNGTSAPTWINQSSGGGGIATQMKFS